MWFAHVWNWFVKLCILLIFASLPCIIIWDVFNCFEMLWFWCVVHWFSYETEMTETITCIIKVRKLIDVSPLKVVHLLNHWKLTFLLLREPLLLCYHQDPLSEVRLEQQMSVCWGLCCPKWSWEWTYNKQRLLRSRCQRQTNRKHQKMYKLNTFLKAQHFFLRLTW